MCRSAVTFLHLLISVYVLLPGIFGMDFFIVLIRAGYRVARRKEQPGRVGKPHRVTKEESMEWFKTKYEGILL